MQIKMRIYTSTVFLVVLLTYAAPRPIYGEGGLDKKYNWTDILDEVTQNIDRLPPEIKVEILPEIAILQLKGGDRERADKNLRSTIDQAVLLDNHYFMRLGPGGEQSVGSTPKSSAYLILRSDVMLSL